MNRIDSKFAELKKQGRKGLVGYLTCGDPNTRTSLKNIRTAIENGVDFLELGMPFSDPTADGPTIQEAAQRALASGTKITTALDMVHKLRKDFDVPIIMFGYANPLFKYGYMAFCADASEAGVDGILTVDLPFEESEELRPFAVRYGIHLIPLIAPTTPKERAKTILEKAGGFVYYIMVKGITGARSTLAEDAGRHVREIRECTQLPVAVGFGISDGEQARKAAEWADAVVVGSAFVKAALAGRLGPLVREIRQALDAAPAGKGP